MSVLFKNSAGWLIAHDQYIKSVYRNVQSVGKDACDMCYTNSMFLIVTPFMRDLQAKKAANVNPSLKNEWVRKRKRMSTKEQITSDEVKHFLIRGYAAVFYPFCNIELFHFTYLVDKYLCYT